MTWIELTLRLRCLEREKRDVWMKKNKRESNGERETKKKEKKKHDDALFSFAALCFSLFARFPFSIESLVIFLSLYAPFLFSKATSLIFRFLQTGKEREQRERREKTERNSFFPLSPLKKEESVVDSRATALLRASWSPSPRQRETKKQLLSFLLFL